MTWFFLALLGIGLYLTIFGLFLLFKSGFVERLRQGIWRPGREDALSEKSGYVYDKYVRGIQFGVSGLIMIAFATYALFRIYGVF